MRQTMDKRKAADSLGWMLLRRLEQRPSITNELEVQLGCCPRTLASNLKRFKSAACDFKTLELIIKRLFYGNHQDMRRRAFNLAYIVYERSSRAFRRLPKEKQKHLRDRSQFASTRRPPFAPWADSQATA